MKYNKEQLVNMLVEDEKQYYELEDEEWEMIESEYDNELIGMGVKEAEKFEVIGCDEDGATIYDFGLGKRIAVCGQGCMRSMMWEEDEC